MLQMTPTIFFKQTKTYSFAINMWSPCLRITKLINPICLHRVGDLDYNPNAPKIFMSNGWNVIIS